MLTPAIDVQNPNAGALALAGDPEPLVETLPAVPWRPVPGSGGLGWGDPLARLLREKARLGPVFRQGKRVILLDPAFNRLVLDDNGTLFAPLAPERTPAAARPPVVPAVLDRVFRAELGRWGPGMVRVQPAMAMVLARALVPAVTGLAAGSGAAEHLAGALATLDDGASLLRRAMPRGLPSSAMGARRALAQGLAQAGQANAIVLQTLQDCHAAGLRLLVSVARHLAQTPDWQDTLRAEVRSARAQDGTLPTGAGLELVDMAICEAWRLTPAPMLVERRLMAPAVFGVHRLETGTVVAISPAVAHADPLTWPAPQRFDPLRFAGPRVQARPAGAWIARDVLDPAVAQAVGRAARLATAHLLDRFSLALAGDGGKLALCLAD